MVLLLFCCDVLADSVAFDSAAFPRDHVGVLCWCTLVEAEQACSLSMFGCLEITAPYLPWSLVIFVGCCTAV